MTSKDYIEGMKLAAKAIDKSHDEKVEKIQALCEPYVTAMVLLLEHGRSIGHSPRECYVGTLLALGGAVQGSTSLDFKEVGEVMITVGKILEKSNR